MRFLARAVLILTVALLAAATLAGGPPSKLADKSKKPPVSEQPPKDDRSSSANKSGIPPGVLVPYEMLKGAPHPWPVYWVPADVYHKMQEQIKELKRQLQPESITSICKLKGRVEGDFVTLQAELIIITGRPATLVTVGFRDAVVSGDPELDGELPVLTCGKDGDYVVRIAKAGSHRLLLPLKLPITPQRQEGPSGGTERGFVVGLPGAAVTRLTLELSRAVKQVRWNGTSQKARPDQPGAWDIALGRTKELKLSWREPTPASGSGPVLTGRWQTTVTIQDNQVVTDARLTIQDRREGNREWRMLTPPGSSLKVLTPEIGPYDIGSADKDGVVVLKGPASDRLTIQVLSQQPRSGKPMPVGPFRLLGAGQQEGTVEVRATAAALRGFRLVYHRQGKVEQQDLPKDRASADVQASFSYREGPGTSRPGAPPRPPLEIELLPVLALVEAAVEHRLHLGREGDDWKIIAETRIQATPLHNGADFLEVLLPTLRPSPVPLATVPATVPAGLSPWLATVMAPLWPGYAPVAVQCEYPKGARLELQADGRKARVQLPRLELERFTVVLKETYLLPHDLSIVRLQLPRPLTALDRGGVVRVETDGSQELTRLSDGAESPADPHHETLTFASAPAQVDLAWRPYRPEVAVVITADVTLERRSAHVREEVRLPGNAEVTGKGPPSRLVELRVPAGVALIKDGAGRLVPLIPSRLPHTPEGERKGAGVKLRMEALANVLVLEYDFSLPALRDKQGRGPAVRSFSVPLLWPTDATRAETKVRIWPEPGTMPQLPDLPLAGEPWKDRRPEVVAGHNSLPALVVEGEGNDLPLTLTLQGSPLPALKDVVAERVLIQVVVDEEGGKRYRARFLLTRLDADHLDIEFPVPLERLQRAPAVLLNGKQLPLIQRQEEGRRASYRVQRNDSQRPLLLDVSYRLEPGSPEPDGLFRTVLYPPVLQGNVYLGRVRWEVVLPQTWTALPPGGRSIAEQRWVRRNWLLAPEAVLSESNLETWLVGEEAVPNSKSKSSEDRPAGLVFWSAGSAPVAVIHFHQLLWLSLCSGLLLLLGVLLLAAPLSRLAFGVAVGLVGLAVLAAALMWPALFPVLAYGCEPGAAVLLLLVSVQWFLQRRYRRQVVFMPGFTRAKPGSSLLRGSSAQRPRDKSTVDAPTGG